MNELSLNQPTSLPPTWGQVEEQINKEMAWLRISIDVFFKKDKHLEQNCCHECFLRQIAILIVSREIKAAEIKRSHPLKSFWIEKRDGDVPILKDSPDIQHGAAWHSETMQIIENHFTIQGFTVVREPSLSWGRADLGIYKTDEKICLLRWVQPPF